MSRTRKDKDKPSLGKNGLYRRDIGKRADGGPPRFYLGRDAAQALIRSLQLQRVWDDVERRTPPGQPPLWDAVTHQIGLAVARGEAVVRLRRPPITPEVAQAMGVPPGDEPALPDSLAWWHAEWIRGLQADFPQVRIEYVEEVPEAEAKLDEILDRRTAEAESVIQESERLRRRPSATPTPATSRHPQTLHGGLDAFAAWVRREKVQPGTDCLIPFAVQLLRCITMIRCHREDVPLDQFGLAEVEAVVSHWHRRPKTRKGTPASIETCRVVIRVFKEFCRWLHRNPDFRWRKPEDWEPNRRLKFGLTPAEVRAKQTTTQVQSYTLEEIGLLWRHGTPWERALLILALNTGFGRAEVESLAVEEVSLDQPHPHYQDLDGSWIRRLRHKSLVWGEWSLWPQTVEAIRWLMRRRGRSRRPELLLTSTGVPLNTPTASGGRGNRIPNCWAKLGDRIRKTHPDFRRLSYNRLRKTAANLVRRASGGETAGVFLSHGRPCKDDLSDRYSDRDFRKVFEAIALVGVQLAPVFESVPHPFPS